ncbi:MAG: Holliday junction branch migration protein RuvA [Anaerolineae bacterium]|nr:Holliday junction branch migration protein RuvA [Anaerolineae bacterium]
MIAALQGDIWFVAEDSLVVKVGGMGLKVFAPAPLIKQQHAGDPITLFTYLVVREDALTLFGFESEAERDFFILLLGVNGVGPRIALSILSTLTLDAIRRAVLSEQADIFSRVPGVGKKNAQKILLHLQGKVGDAGTSGLVNFEDVDGSVIEALTALGYSVVEAQTALQSLPKDAPRDTESRLRLALQYFFS